jgi:hypothetical protein
MGTLTELKPGSHIKVSRFLYEHHGIFIGIGLSIMMEYLSNLVTLVFVRPLSTSLQLVKKLKSFRKVQSLIKL